MTAPVLTAATGATCPHGGLVVFQAGQERVTSGGVPLLTTASGAVVVGCPNVVNGVPAPCLTVSWQGAARRVSVLGSPLLLATSTGTCLSGASEPQGAMIVTDVQVRVRAV